MWPNPQKTVDLVTFTEEILNGKLNFLCSVTIRKCYQGHANPLSYGCLLMTILKKIVQVKYMFRDLIYIQVHCWLC